MSNGLLEGVGLTMAAGLMSGNCMLPMEFARRWRWENLWLVFSLTSLLILPWALAFGFVHRLLDVYRAVPISMLALPLLFGAGWGIAQILFGISIRRLGLGVGYAIIVGLGAVLGTVVPLFSEQRRVVSSGALIEILAGVIVMIAGITLTTWGGQIRERSTCTTPVIRTDERGYRGAVLLALLCGVMAPMLNYAFAFGQGLTATAVLLGNTPVTAAYAVWPIALLGGLVPNVIYSVFLLQRNQSWKVYR